MSGKLILGEDGGGPRHFLDGRPVSCGTGLEMKAGEKWVAVRYEADLCPGHIEVYLYAYPWRVPCKHEEDCSCYGPLVVVCRWSRAEFKEIPNVELRWPVRK